MPLTLKSKFICIGTLMVASVIANGLFTHNSLTMMDEQADHLRALGEYQKAQLEMDMMHDAINSDVSGIVRTVERNNPEMREATAKTLDEHLKRLDGAIAKIEKLDMPETAVDTNALIAQFGDYKKDALNIINAGMNADAMPGLFAIFSNQFETLGKNQKAIENKLGDLIDRLGAQQDDTVSNGKRIMLGLTLLVMLLGTGVPVFALLAIFRPLARLTQVMQSMAEGNYEHAIPATERKDELGDIAHSAQVFKENGLAKIQMEIEQKEQARRAEEDKRAAMQTLANGFEASIKGIVSMVAAAATELAHTAEELVGAMSKTSDLVGSATAGASQTSANVQSVASAAEEMTSSVKEISSQLQASNTMVQDSVQRAEAADTQAISLSNATSKVKEVISLIASIAGQINLLALNATIESARAGDAGKGFAVVASEVKNLASQTDKSVQEIEKVIQEMNLASDEIISSLKGIKDSVQNIAGSSSTIAAAVEEQSATTNEIARNMHSAAQGTEHISSNLHNVSSSTSHATSASQQVLEASKELSKQAEELNKEVETFLQTVRAA